MMTMIVILISPIAAAQSNQFKKKYKQALRFLYEENFDFAKKEFEEIYRIDPEYEDVEYRLELTYFLDGDHNRSLDRLISFENTLASNDKFYHYWLGRVFALKYMYREAVESWNEFLDLNAFKSYEISQETYNFIASAKIYIDFYSDRSNYVVTMLPEIINSEKTEVNPTFSASNRQLLYSTSSTTDGNKDKFEILGSTIISEDIVPHSGCNANRRHTFAHFLPLFVIIPLIH